MSEQRTKSNDHRAKNNKQWAKDIEQYEQKVTSNKQKVTNNEQKVTSYEQKVTSNEQKVTSYEQKVTSNEQRVKSSTPPIDFALRIYWRLFTYDFKNKKKCVWSIVFWYVKVCIFWKCIKYTVLWDKAHILKKFLRTK